MERTIALSVGDDYHLGTGKHRIVYAGMPSEDVFSIAVRRWAFVYQGYAWNLFFPKDSREIRIDGINLIVESVGADKIVLRG